MLEGGEGTKEAALSSRSLHTYLSVLWLCWWVRVIPKTRGHTDRAPEDSLPSSVPGILAGWEHAGSMLGSPTWHRRDPGPGEPCMEKLECSRDWGSEPSPIPAASLQETYPPPHSCPLFEVSSVRTSVAGSLSHPGWGLLSTGEGCLIPEPPQVLALSTHLEGKTSRPRPLRECSRLRLIGNGVRVHTCHCIT